MSDPFIAEIRMSAGNFAPKGWAFCNGQLLPINQNTAVFSLLGTIYGGDGRTNFALPDLQGRAPMHRGQGPGLTLRDQGETGGTTTHTLVVTEIPAHNHQASGSATPGPTSPQNASWGTLTGHTPPPAYSSATPDVTMSPQALAPAGGSLPHNNLQPYLAVNFIISLQGIYPPRP